MSVQALAAAFAFQAPSPTCKLVLLALANYADKAGRCWPSQKVLAADTGLTERSIRSALTALRDLGALASEERRRPDGSRSSDIITLNILQPETPSGGAERASGGGETPSGHEPPTNLSSEANASSPPLKVRASRRAPDGWEPSPQAIETLTAKGYSPGELERALAMVRNHEFRHARSNWDGVFQNWVLRDPPSNVITLHDRPSPPDHKRQRKDAQRAAMLAGSDLLARARAAGDRDF